jgi:hypothetical protein
MEKTPCDYARYVFATVLTILSLGIIGYAIAEGHAALPGHPIMQYVLLVFDLTLLAYLEGLQVAILALERVRYSTFPEHMTRAIASHKLATAGRGINVQRFLVGRQFFVVFVVFLCAQLTTYATLDMPWMPDTLFIILIETGLPGALIVLAFGQLMPQLVAATHPITFMNLPGTWSVIQLCLVFESFGVTHFSWVLSWTVKKIFRMGDKERIKKSKKSGNVMKGIEMTTNPKKSTKSGAPSYKADEGNVQVGGLNMDVHIMDADALYSATEDGLSLADNDDVYSATTIRWLQNDSIKNIAQTYASGESEKACLPDPPTIVRYLVQNGQPVPRYLLPPYHPKHIPPHIVAFELIRREQTRKNRAEKRAQEQC